MRDSKNTRDVINEITTKRILTLTNTQESLKLSSPSKLQKIQINLKEDLKQPVKKSKSAGKVFTIYKVSLCVQYNSDIALNGQSGRTESGQKNLQTNSKRTARIRDFKRTCL